MLGRAAKTASHLATVEKELDVIRAEKASELNDALAALNESFFLLGQVDRDDVLHKDLVS